MAWQCGFGKADVTPPVGGGAMDLRILGFWYERDKPYGGVHDPLHARAMAVSNGPETAVVVSVDMICDGEGFGDLARARLEAELGVPRRNVMIACTHCHTTPTTAFSDRSPDSQWTEYVADGIRKAAGDAVQTMNACAIELGETTVSAVAENRRTRWCAEEMARLNPASREREAFHDERMQVAAFRDASGALMGRMTHFACHPVALQTRPIISSDFPGVLSARLEETMPVALYLNGGCGNVNPVRAAGFEDVLWTGRTLADAALTVKGVPLSCEEALCAATRRIALQRRAIADVAGLQAEATDLAREAAASPLALSDPRHPGCRLYHVQEALAVARMPETVHVEIQAIRIGSWLLVGVPGELAACLAEEIRSAGDPLTTWVVGYANGYAGYILTRAAYEVGGYEARPGRWSFLAPGSGEIVRDAAMELVRNMTDTQERGF